MRRQFLPVATILAIGLPYLGCLPHTDPEGISANPSLVRIQREGLTCGTTDDFLIAPGSTGSSFEARSTHHPESVTDCYPALGESVVLRCHSRPPVTTSETSYTVQTKGDALVFVIIKEDGAQRGEQPCATLAGRDGG